jgi:hypothetical protein
MKRCTGTSLRQELDDMRSHFAVMDDVQTTSKSLIISLQAERDGLLAQLTHAQAQADQCVRKVGGGVDKSVFAHVPRVQNAIQQQENQLHASTAAAVAWDSWAHAGRQREADDVFFEKRRPWPLLGATTAAAPLADQYSTASLWSHPSSAVSSIRGSPRLLASATAVVAVPPPPPPSVSRQHARWVGPDSVATPINITRSGAAVGATTPPRQVSHSAIAAPPVYHSPYRPPAALIANPIPRAAGHLGMAAQFGAALAASPLVAPRR